MQTDYSGRPVSLCSGVRISDNGKRVPTEVCLIYLLRDDPDGITTPYSQECYRTRETCRRNPRFLLKGCVFTTNFLQCKKSRIQYFKTYQPPKQCPDPGGHNCPSCDLIPTTLIFWGNYSVGSSEPVNRILPFGEEVVSVDQVKNCQGFYETIL